MKSLIYKIKHNRLPEAFLVEILNGMIIIEQSEYKNSIFYEYNNEIILEQDIKNKYVWISNDIMIKISEKFKQINPFTVFVIIQNIIEEHTNIKGYYIVSENTARWTRLKKKLKR